MRIEDTLICSACSGRGRKAVKNEWVTCAPCAGVGRLDPRILVTGGRVAVDDRVAAKAITVVIGALGDGCVFGDGDALGYDRLLRSLAKAQGCHTESFGVDRAKDGDGDDAPKKRNIRMFNDFRPTHCLAMPGGPGTRHMWLHCFEKYVPVISVEVENNHIHISLMRRHYKAINLFNGPIA